MSLRKEYMLKNCIIELPYTLFYHFDLIILIFVKMILHAFLTAFKQYLIYILSIFHDFSLKINENKQIKLFCLFIGTLYGFNICDDKMEDLSKFCCDWCRGLMNLTSRPDF